MAFLNSGMETSGRDYRKVVIALDDGISNRDAPTVVGDKKKKAGGGVDLEPALSADFFSWAQRDLNPRLQPCEGRTLPLSYAPDASCDAVRREPRIAQVFLRFKTFSFATQMERSVRTNTSTMMASPRRPPAMMTAACAGPTSVVP